MSILIYLGHSKKALLKGDFAKYIYIKGASSYEQEERDGWCPNWADAISEVGRKLNLSRMEVPLTFLQKHLKESGIPAGGAQGGGRWRGGEAFIFVKIVLISNSWSPIFEWETAKGRVWKSHKKHESESCRRHCLYFVLFWGFASVLDEESLDLKVLVNKDWEIQPSLAVQRNNIQHEKKHFNP